MSLKALRTLVTIARHRTFARAADVLSLTHSAVSLTEAGHLLELSGMSAELARC